MFRIVSPIGILGMAALMFLIRRRNSSPKRVAGPCRPFRMLVSALTVLCTVLLAVSGFTASVVLARPMTGYLLLSHVAVGGMFAVCLAATALWWAEAHRAETLEEVDTSGRDGGRVSVIRKSFFWCFVAFGFGSTVTVLLSMTPVFGLDSLGVLAELHRWCALLMVMAGIGFGMSE